MSLKLKMCYVFLCPMQRIMRHSSSLGRLGLRGPLWQKKFPDGLQFELASILVPLDLKKTIVF